MAGGGLRSGGIVVTRGPSPHGMAERLRRRLEAPPADFTPFAASELVLDLKQAAPWCLTPAVLQRAAESPELPSSFRRWTTERPGLVEHPGGCHVLFATAVDDPHRRLRPAFVLPLQWLEARSHSAGLPRKLRALADRVLGALNIARPSWGLQFAPELGELDASDWPVDVESGWASLAGGLLLARDGGRPAPTTWASAAWDPDSGVRRVERLDAKFELACEWGAEWLLVPDVQVEVALALRSRCPDGPQIQGLRTGELNLRTALGPLLDRLEVPPVWSPSDSRSFQRCCEYYNRGVPARLERSDYYRRQLLAPLIEHLGAQAAADFPDWRPTHLVTIVSQSPDLVRLVPRVLQIRHCLLLHTDDASMQNTAAEIGAELTAAGIDCRLSPFSASADPLEAFVPHLRDFLTAAPAAKTAIDVTPGSKRMSLALASLARADDWLIYVESQQKDRRPFVGSERIIRWRASRLS